MPSYIIRNGQLQIRQKDFNIPNYRIIPYKSSINATQNDYVTNTIDQLRKEIQKANQDYRNLIQTMWKMFSQIDRISYDPQIMFIGLKCEEIYDKISMIRNINGFNAFESEQESLRLSAIIKVDDMTPIYPIQQSEISPARSKLREEIKQDSLYEIQEEEECISTSSHRENKQKHPQNEQNSLEHKQQEKIPSPKRSHRLSLQNITNHKRDSSRGSRSSLFLREKISLAFHEQQELRQILEEELEKITQELEQKTECLTWAVDELHARNEMIEKLKETIWQRDEALQVHEQKLKAKETNLQVSKFQELIDVKDRQIGVLINSLIERTQDTGQDVEYLKKSIQVSLSKAHNEGQTREEEDEKKVDQSVYLEDLENSVRDEISDKIAKSPSLQGKEVSSQMQRLEYSDLRPKKMNFDSSENITYLTKQHFLQAEKNSQNILLPNIKMTQSIKGQNRGRSPGHSE